MIGSTPTGAGPWARASALSFAVALSAGALAGVALADPGLRARARILTGDAGAEGMVGRPIQVEIEARHAPGRVALLPDRLDLPAALGERRRQRTHTRRVEGSTEIDVYRLELLPFMPGLVEIPPLPLALGSTVAQTEPLLIQVATSLAPSEAAVATSTRPENLAALENLAAGDPPPASVQIPDYRVALAAIAVLGLALVVAFGRKLLARRQRAALAPASAPPPRPAHEVALEALAALEASPRLEQGELNRYFTELSFVVRRYLGARYGFDALERTIDELSDKLARLSTPGLDRRGIAALLFEAEQVKFAKYTPRPEDARAALARAREMIERTRYDARPASEAAAESVSPSPPSAAAPAAAPEARTDGGGPA